MLSADDEISDTPDFKNTFPPHCMANTEGVNFIALTSLAAWNFPPAPRIAGPPFFGLILEMQD